MKKYISVLMLAPVVLMLSCDRDNVNNQMPHENRHNVEFRRNQHQAEPASAREEQAGSESKETGDDDEPQDDKQHWKAHNDSIS
ncbi:hypothetical protein [Chryseobacterium cheonjiense]|uniref:Lipoprotein n=1 Tax=Chryseobacterium cheonjiense TaxID=2728845 RepID=A0A7Y0A4Y2_9FLAO|nr:hypothetical protein [Chryseobacterium cheonjiense]NML56775.1 hypothetical protein [Chryseobacterium cheonjiense]